MYLSHTRQILVCALESVHVNQCEKTYGYFIIWILSYIKATSRKGDALKTQTINMWLFILI